MNESNLREFWAHFRTHRGAVLAGALLIALMLTAIFAPVLAPYDPIEQYRDAIRVPPAWQENGSWRFILGTDQAGRDILSRLIYGARLSFWIGSISVLLALSLGTVLGLCAAFFQRWLDAPIMRLIDVLLALPALLLAVAVVAILGPGLTNTMYAIAIVTLPGYVRLTRASALAELSKEYVVASRVAGASTFRLMFSQVLPNCAAPLIVQATLGFSTALLDAAALGFLGIGVQPPLAEWGSMLASARDYMNSAWWMVTMPGVAILVTVLSINLLGDGLRDALDPKLKQIY
ncbi:ABC transporter permease subunit [Mycoavidus sp. B2-EB]|uniref:ABC transporter permease subunit n=1 Tax=Mycoavidus sp. B2-EB TaxID=2651972 RepID=UPI0016245EAD|nr:ABC transporter permease subunit [Mycoavidus sp. B2-EB]BBO60470.1 peptide ABC transporter permease [Mycoavidus sp. B2-EB]